MLTRNEFLALRPIVGVLQTPRREKERLYIFILLEEVLTLLKAEVLGNTVENTLCCTKLAKTWDKLFLSME